MCSLKKIVVIVIMKEVCHFFFPKLRFLIFCIYYKYMPYKMNVFDRN